MKELVSYLKNLIGEKKTAELLSAAKKGDTVLIKGLQGPTGKSSLKKVLIDHGIKAIEEHKVYVVELNKIVEKPISNFSNELYPGIDKAKKYEPMEIREARKEAISDVILQIFIQNTMSETAALETLKVAIDKIKDNKELLDKTYFKQSPLYQ